MKQLSAFLLALTVACSAPGLSKEQIQDPSLVGKACKVDPIGFDRKLVVRSPLVSFPSGDVLPATAQLIGILDDGQTTFSVFLVRGGSSWRWIRVAPDVTLPGDTTIPAVRVSTDVGYRGSVTERFAWPLTRGQVEEFGRAGFLGDITAGPRVSFPAALFSGFLMRWDDEVARL